jgi:hypothetical protein
VRRGLRHGSSGRARRAGRGLLERTAASLQLQVAFLAGLCHSDNIATKSCDIARFTRLPASYLWFGLPHFPGFREN